MSNPICPYCEKEVLPFDGGIEPSVNHEEECPDCGKTFLFQVEYWPTYTEWKAPCLNGGGHLYQKIDGYPEEYWENRRQCKWCEDEIMIEEAQATGEAQDGL